MCVSIYIYIYIYIYSQQFLTPRINVYVYVYIVYVYVYVVVAGRAAWVARPSGPGMALNIIYIYIYIEYITYRERAAWVARHTMIVATGQVSGPAGPVQSGRAWTAARLASWARDGRIERVTSHPYSPTWTGWGCTGAGVQHARAVQQG
jgi:hypothetical protein